MTATAMLRRMRLLSLPACSPLAACIGVTRPDPTDMPVATPTCAVARYVHPSVAIQSGPAARDKAVPGLVAGLGDCAAAPMTDHEDDRLSRIPIDAKRCARRDSTRHAAAAPAP